MISTILLMLSGPALIFMSWHNPEHILRTAAIAGIMVGMVIFCVRLINKGMTEDDPTEGSAEGLGEEAANPPEPQ
jgi:hypothetical protein